ncbi:MAG: phosphoribosyltransferase [Ardenticatenaceae bacterium]|nr:phosphoribosyltransferase [Ardenticatenaceae bacterium]
MAEKAQRPLSLIRVNYRNIDNTPKYDAPRVKSPIPTLPAGGRILLVDDVAVTGKTIGVVCALLADYAVTTLVFKGLGDIVLFPEMTTCVAWPWRQAAVSIHDCWIA